MKRCVSPSYQNILGELLLSHNLSRTLWLVIAGKSDFIMRIYDHDLQIIVMAQSTESLHLRDVL